jgi:hypothetical protein
MRSPLLVFECPDFAIQPDEDEETNPGVYGRALATWLAGELRAAGVPVGEVFAEDFGWCFGVDDRSAQVHVTCSSGHAPDEWQVFVMAEGGLLKRILGNDPRPASVAKVFSAVRQRLHAAGNVRGLREEVG